MARAIWKGSINFGLVEIPVALQVAERTEDEIAFRMLDRRTMTPVGFQRVNKESGEEVPWLDVVKGYEHEKDQFVVLTEDELKKANVEASQSVDIVAFVDLAEIDSFYFERPYYLVPTRKKSKSYTLLHETLRRTRKAGIAKVVLRTRQHLAAVVVRGPALALILLRYADEILEPAAAGVEEPDRKALGVKEAELKLAEALVAGMTRKWDPREFHDEYREDVMALIERKVKSVSTEADDAPADGARPRRRGAIVDLMPLLKESVEAAQRGPRAIPNRRRRVKGA